MSNADSTLTGDRLRELYEYNHTTGLFTSLRLGRTAGTLSDQGYMTLQIDGKTYRAHRLAWLYVYDRFPDGPLDHKNRDRADNRMCNLRLATHALNRQNTTITRAASGVRGVRQSQKGRWLASITVDGKDFHLGTFPTLELASEARATAEARLHPFSPIAGA